MKPLVFLETDPDRKRQLQMRLTVQLPDWFGQPDSNAQYAKQAQVLDGYVATVDRDPCGLLMLKKTAAISAEIYWMANRSDVCPSQSPVVERREFGAALARA